jgi:hypothetical protein
MTPKENIQLAKDGLTATLVSYLSEYSISLLLLSYFALSYYLPVFKTPLSQAFHLKLSVETKIFFAILLFLLLQPVGAITTMTSWALLGCMERFEETFHFQRKTFLSRGIKNYFCFTKLVEEMGLTAANFYDTAREKEHYLTTNDSDRLNVTDFALGSSVLFRNISFCTLLLSAAHFANGQRCLGLIMLGTFLIATILNSTTSFYYSLYVLNMWRNISRTKNDS